MNPWFLKASRIVLTSIGFILSLWIGGSWRRNLLYGNKKQAGEDFYNYDGIH